MFPGCLDPMKLIGEVARVNVFSGIGPFAIGIREIRRYAESDDGDSAHRHRQHPVAHSPDCFRRPGRQGRRRQKLSRIVKGRRIALFCAGRSAIEMNCAQRERQNQRVPRRCLKHVHAPMPSRRPRTERMGASCISGCLPMTSSRYGKTLQGPQFPVFILFE